MRRIALVGNMNNNFFAITRYLRDAGYDAHLYYRVAMQHFQPAADTYTHDYHAYCHEVKWLENGFHNIDLREIKEELGNYSFFIGQGEEAAAASAAGYNIDVYYPYGSDVYKYAWLPQEYSMASKIKSLLTNDATRPTYRQMQLGTMAKHLHGAIVNASYILAEKTNADFESKLAGLHYKGIYKHVPMPFIYWPEYETANAQEISHKTQIDAIRATYDFVLLYHGRQEWYTYHNDFTGKNTNYLIQGFATFVNVNPDAKACLVMLEYGTDTIHSKKLVEELGIQNKIVWLPKMYRKEIMYVVKNADVCCGEFDRSYLTFGTVVEAMLMNKPVITYRDDKLYEPQYNELYPCFNAREPGEIATAITEAYHNPAKVKQMGTAAGKWIKQHFINTPLHRLIAIINAKG